MAYPDERPETRRGVLKSLAAAGLGAAIATVAARKLPPSLGGPTPDVPPISGPGPLDAVFNVSDQGAVGDGVADDTGALMRTIGRVPASGGLVYLPRGTYRVTSPIAVGLANVWIFGSGPDASVIRLADGVNTDVMRVGAGGCTVSNLTIDGNKARNASGAGILVDTLAANEMLENVTVRDLRVVRTKGAGIKIHSSPSGPVNRRNLVESCVVDDTDAEGIALMAADQSIVASCFVSRTGNHGIISKQGDENTLLGNHVLEAGINKSSGFAHGIAIDGNGGANPNGRHRILGNYVFDASDAGIEVADAVDDVLIEGNTVNGAGVGALAVNRYGIFFGGGFAPSSKGTIRGNTVTRAGTSGIQVAGPSSLARASSLVIEGNLCYGNGENGIYLKAVDNFVVNGNDCFNNDTSATEKDGIRLEGVWDGIVEGNRCYDDQEAKTQAHGLGILTGATNVLVAMNDLSGNAVGAIGSANLFAGTSRLYENKGFNPLGVSRVTIGPSPWTYTNNDFVREAIYIRGGTVSDVTKDGLAGIFAGSNVTVWLEPGESLTLTYSSPPIVSKDRK
jgi:parallel beta-helix repeat protein